MSFLEKQDPNIQAVINQELARQRDKLEMIMAVVKMLMLSKH